MTFNSVRYTALTIAALSFYLGLAICNFGTAQTEVSASKWFENEQGKVRLISAARGVGNSKNIQLGLQFKLKDNWKIYWRTPGDAGYPPQLDWKNSSNLKQTLFTWPAPTRFQVLGFQTIGYKKEVVFPIVASVNNPERSVQLRLALNYLTCDDICIPIKTNLALNLPSDNGTATEYLDLIRDFASRVPHEGSNDSLKILQVETAGEFKTIDKNVRKGFIRLVIESALPLINPDVFVEGPELAFFSLPQIKLGDDGKKAVMTIPVSEEGGTKIEHTSLRFTITDGQRSITENHLVSAGSLISQTSSDVQISLLFILGLALIGGIILNLMPCVLPVLSIKILGLVAHSGATSTTIRMSFLASSLGIIFSFLVIATGLIILKLTGSAVGWGIQFQEPWFIVSLTVIVSLFAYNLFGFFELNLPSWLGNIAGRPIITNELHQNFSVNFAAGSFATILATPCSAPFLGTAVGFALAGSLTEIYAVFAALGIGMALPYFLIALFPVLANWLPKPGVWMVRVKQLLGAALIATAVWLIMVLAVQSNISSATIIGVLMIAIGGILFGKKYITGSWQKLATFAIFVFIFGAIFTPYYLTQRGSLDPHTRASDHWVAFAPERIAELVSNGKTVFMDVTAEWCITCYVNKVAVLNRGQIYEVLSKSGNVIAMKGDWTRPNQKIANYLKSFGRFGIPFNAVYGPKAKEGVVLPELLTAGIVRAGFRKASGDNIFSKK